MRRLLLVALNSALAACATAPRQPEPQPVPVAPQPPASTGLRGSTVNELIGRFGSPALQVREGASLKLQFRGRLCVLDAYFYPQSNVMRVTHVDTRTPAGGATNQAACISALENPS